MSYTVQQPVQMVAVQPQAIPVMTVGNRNPRNLPHNSQGKRMWSHDFFSCCDDCNTCCCTMWCPCIVYARTKHRLEHLNANGRPDPMGIGHCAGECVNADCCTYLCLANCWLSWILLMSNRSAVRNRYNIDGGAVGDCCSGLCCPCCDLVQQSREVELEERALHHHH